MLLACVRSAGESFGEKVKNISKYPFEDDTVMYEQKRVPTTVVACVAAAVVYVWACKMQL